MHRLHVHDLLQRVVQDAVTRDLQQEALAVSEQLANLGVPESPHQEEIGVQLPLNLVVALEHARLVVRCH